jgi:hypothetical protein
MADMALFAACFIILFAVPCAIYVSAYLAKRFTEKLTAKPRP